MANTVHVFDNGEWHEYTKEEFYGVPVYEEDSNEED